MPKLDEKAIQKRKRQLEDAALALFRERGFAGVGLREIAKEAGVSLGNLYNYFDRKEQLFESILERLHESFIAPNSALSKYLERSRFPDDLEELGTAIGRMVKSNNDYLKLIYIDIVEFGGRHARPQYENLAARFEAVLHDRFEQLREEGRPADVDPALAFTAVYMQFFNYFIVERMIGAEGHMGLSEKKTVLALASLYRHGIDSEVR